MSQSFSRVQNAFALFVLSLLWISVPVLVFKGARSVQAQTVDEREAEASRLFQQGIQQGKTSQFQAALQSFQKALEIYQKLGNRAGEGNSLNNLGNVYRFLGQYEKAVEFHQQSLAIAREIGDNTKPLIGDRATRQAVVQQMSNANIIHLATHGLLDDFRGQGVPGAIALAPDGTGERNDGK